ncbi:MAG: hypothetical protein AAGB35_06230 [Pseudomonadota bacterium]
MSKAKFVFHGLFPDVVETGDQPKQIAKILFDVEFEGQFHSHLLAELEYIEKYNEFEVRSKLPFACKEFHQAVVQYHQYALGPQAATITHSGPKGASIATNNVMRMQWAVELDVSSI